jgi:hypothetical protein
MSDVAVILSIHKRLHLLGQTLARLNYQVFKEFDVFISGHKIEGMELVNSALKKYKNELNISYCEASQKPIINRFFLARTLAKQGYKKIIFIDDDVWFTQTFVQTAVASFEPKTYKSWWVWDIAEVKDSFTDGRTRIRGTGIPANYCGTGVSIIDSSVFLDDNFFNYPSAAEWMEDIWLSYYCDHVLKWRLGYLPVVADFFNYEADSEYALYRNIFSITNMEKHEFVHLLKSKYGWTL